METEYKAGFPQANFFARSEFLEGEKVETVRTHFLAERKGASENVAPVGIKLHLRELEKIRFARKNSPVENRFIEKISEQVRKTKV